MCTSKMPPDFCPYRCRLFTDSRNFHSEHPLKNLQQSNYSISRNTSTAQIFVTWYGKNIGGKLLQCVSNLDGWSTERHSSWSPATNTFINMFSIVIVIVIVINTVDLIVERCIVISVATTTVFWQQQQRLLYTNHSSSNSSSSSSSNSNTSY